MTKRIRRGRLAIVFAVVILLVAASAVALSIFEFNPSNVASSSGAGISNLTSNGGLGDLQSCSPDYAANCAGANLRYADFQGADFSGVNMTGANLEHANFQFAILENATLVNADFLGTHLEHADLLGADLTGAKLDGAFFCETTMPDGTINEVDCSG